MIDIKLSHYSILEQLGAGGMGEVYLAEDTKLGRQVAIKVLPDMFARDEERLARFEREAKVLASLNHPNIAAIHGLEEAEGKRFLVMELVEGDTLEQKLGKGGLPTEEALKLCFQVAEAIEAAHEKDIIHRDLKPANVKITPEGRVKVLDFGLAKGLIEEEVGPDLSKSPTITAQMTHPGVILGTAPYMSPEQAKGEDVDKRTDIWAFGCILYECLTSKRAFEGKTVSETVATILKDEPDWRILPEQLPTQVKTLLSRCLQKSPERRPRDIRDIKLEIADSQNLQFDMEGSPDIGSSRTRPKPLTLIGIMAVLVLLAALVGIIIDRTWLKPAAEQPSLSSVHFSIDLPKEHHVRFFRDNTFIAISPDGERIAWIGETGRIFTRELNGLEVREVAGTEDLSPRSPIVFSPDGLKIGFMRGFTIYAVPIQGGVPRRLYGDESMTGLYSFDWGDDGSLLLHFANSAILKLTEGETQPEFITNLDKEKNEFTHLWPTMLPGSTAVVFGVSVGNYANTHIEVLSLESGKRHKIIEDSYIAEYSPTGHILFARDGTLYAVPFDLESLRVTGSEEPILSNIQMNTVNHWIPGFCISKNGTLVYIPDSQGFGEYQLVWINRQNELEPLPGAIGFFGRPTLSPDGKKLAYQRLEGTGFQLFLYDLERQLTTQFTYEGYNIWPVWSPDGTKLIFSSGREYQFNMYEKSISGSQSPIRIIEHPLMQIPTSWHKNGDFLAYTERDEADRRATWLLRMNQLDSPPTPLLKSNAQIGNAIFLPNGKWIAYVSDEQGQPEVFIKEINFNDLTSGRIEKVSRNGGIDPIWSRDGMELFYRSLDEVRLLKVSFETNPLRIGNEQVVLEQPRFLRSDWLNFFGIYDVSLDGGKFIAVLEKEPPEIMRINVVLNWFEELKEKLSEGK